MVFLCSKFTSPSWL